MAAKAHTNTLRWSRNRGRNGWDIPSDVSPEMSCESMNLLLEKNTLGRKRRGSKPQTFSGDAIGTYEALHRFVPGQDDTAAEAFIVSIESATNKILRVAGGTSASNLTRKDDIATNPHLVRAAILNGKFYLAYDSTVNRLHVFDPALSTSTVRRAGLATPAAPSVANTGSGSYAATLRYYRIEWRVKVSSTVQRRSLLGTATSFTPSGSGTHARVTQPTVPSEGETHWAIYGSADDEDYYELAEVAIGTTTYDDNETPASYDDNTAAPDEGTFTPFPSVKYLLSTGDRLIGFGVWETSAGDSLAPKPGRIYFTPVLDTTDSDDDERISNTLEFKGYIDFSRNAGAEDRAIAGPLDGTFLAFQSRGIAAFIQTGAANQPYQRVTRTNELGAVSQESTFMGEDEEGAPCIYFVDPVRGPYRYGSSGFQWLGYDVQDVWATVNLAATVRVAAGVYDAELRAVIFGLATGSSNVLNEFLVFFVREGMATSVEGVRGGWVRWQNAATPFTFRCLAMLPEELAATMSRSLKPYAGHSTKLLRLNDESVQQDDSSSFQAYATSPAFNMGRMQFHKRLAEPYLQALAVSGVTITQTWTRNHGDETGRTSTVSLTPTGSQTRVVRKFEGGELVDADHAQVTLGDGSAANNAWTMDEWIAPFEMQEAL